MARPTLLATMPNTIRTMIYMREVQGMTLMEISRATNTSMSSVMKYTRSVGRCVLRRHQF